MNKGGIKFFIFMVLLLGAVVALGEIFYSVFDIKPEALDPSYTVSQPLPTELQTEFLVRFSDRAEKYLKISAEDFEKGITPEELEKSAEENLEIVGTDNETGDEYVGDLP